MDLKVREEELRALASENAIDWKERLETLPDDPRLRIAALATLLRIDPMEALRGDTPTKKLVAESRERTQASEKFDRQEREFLKSLGLDKEREG
jgi:hypothetical protein